MTSSDNTAERGIITDHGSRQFWPDLLRIVAAFAVVFLHVAAERISPIDASHPEWWAVVVCRVLPSFAVPVFFMLSGIALNHLSTSIGAAVAGRPPYPWFQAGGGR